MAVDLKSKGSIDGIESVSSLHRETQSLLSRLFICVQCGITALLCGWVGDCFMRRNHVPGVVQIHYFWLKSAVKLVVLCLFVTLCTKSFFFVLFFFLILLS